MKLSQKFTPSLHSIRAKITPSACTSFWIFRCHHHRSRHRHHRAHRRRTHISRGSRRYCSTLMPSVSAPSTASSGPKTPSSTTAADTSEREVLQAFDLSDILAALDRKQAAAPPAEGLRSSVSAYRSLPSSSGECHLAQASSSARIQSMLPASVRTACVSGPSSSIRPTASIAWRSTARCRTSVWISGVLETAGGDEFFNAQGDPGMKAAPI